MQKDAPPLRPVPFTEERALTELVRCRRELDAAIESLVLAVDILSRLDGGPPRGVLEDVLGRMEEAAVMLRPAVSRRPARTR